MNERLVLLVEDNEVNRDMLVRRLERAGHQVSTAADGMPPCRQCEIYNRA